MGVDYIKSENKWVYETKNNTKDGYKIYYKCKNSQRKIKNNQNFRCICYLEGFVGLNKIELFIVRSSHICIDKV